jgi:hypothetical protein
MLLPDNIQPELTLYYIGGLILKNLKVKNALSVVDLFQLVKKENEDVSFSSYLLSLDWLYLIDAAGVQTNGDVALCS